MWIVKEQLNLAGWASMTSALFTVPHIWMSMYFETMEGPGARLSEAAMIAVALGLSVYVLLSFKRLLNARFQFHAVDTYILLVISGNGVLSGLALFSVGSMGPESLVAALSMLTFIPFGIFAIMFATRLLRIPGNLYGLLKPFSYTLIMCGACFVTIMLSPVGYIFSVVSDVILGIIFFRAADQPPPDAEISGMPIE